jgi:hypothetical protein
MQYALLFLHLHFNKGIIVKTSFLRALMAITLFAGSNLSANAGVVKQDVTPAARLGSSPLPGFNAPAPVLVVPMPAQIFPVESLPLTPQPLLPVAIEEPAAVPEPATLATLAAGLVLMGVFARRRRAAPRA